MVGGTEVMPAATAVVRINKRGNEFVEILCEAHSRHLKWQQNNKKQKCTKGVVKTIHLHLP